VYEQWGGSGAQARKDITKTRGMGGWALPKEKNFYRCTINIPTHPTHPFSVSLENAFVTSGRGFYGKTGSLDGAAHIYSIEYIKQCESHAFCRIPALNQLPLGTLASLNRIVPSRAPLCYGQPLQRLR